MPRLENGFVYLWALFSVMLAGIAMAGAGQIWQTKSQREKEVELMFIGEEFRKAIMSYYNSGPKQYPNSLEDLLQDSRTPNTRRHLRKIYIDPITNTTEWGIIYESDSGAAPSSGSSATSSSSASGKTQSSSGNPAPASDNPQSPSSNPLNNQASSPTQPSNKSPAPASSSAPSKSSGVSSSIAKGITGVYSLSEKKPIKKDQFPEHLAKFSEATNYKDWQFIYKPGASKPPSASGSAKPGAASTPATGSSPFSSQSSPSKGGGASPFSSPSSSTDSKVPASGFSAQ